MLYEPLKHLLCATVHPQFWHLPRVALSQNDSQYVSTCIAFPFQDLFPTSLGIGRLQVEVLQNLPIIIVLEFHTTKRNTRQVRDKATLVYHLTTVFFFTENQRTGGRKQETEGALSDYWNKGLRPHYTTLPFLQLLSSHTGSL